MIPWLVALAIVLLYLSYSLGVRHGLQFGQRERKTLRDGLEAARRQLSEIAPFQPPVFGQPVKVHHCYRRPMGVPPRMAS